MDLVHARSSSCELVQTGQTCAGAWLGLVSSSSLLSICYEICTIQAGFFFLVMRRFRAEGVHTSSVESGRRPVLSGS